MNTSKKVRIMSISDWYWNFGQQRTGEYRLDPDSWFDSVAQVEKVRQRIMASQGAKTCVALWGMSQTGKSTLLSSYLDGRRCKGSDGALSYGENVRFLAVNQQQQQAADVVFNPYNAGMDASGVATRYTLLQDINDVNQEYPVEMKLMTHGQFLHALARGYVSECQQQNQVLTSEIVRGYLNGGNNDHIERAAYEMMQDALDVIELMRDGSTRFVALFQNGGWSALRRECLRSRSVLSSINDCKSFIQRLFWDDNERITSLYNNVMNFFSEDITTWHNSRILVSMSVAAKLLNIDTGANLGRANGDVASWRFEDGNIFVSINHNDRGNGITGRQFGYLQALCKELVVPVRLDRLKNRGPVLAQFLQRADILDLPGLSRVAADGNLQALRDANNLEECEILRYVLKEGRTQSYVYNYAKAYNVDAFIVMVKCNEYVGKPQILDDGLKNWLQAYAPDWTFHTQAAMPIFIDITFFGSHVQNAMIAQNDNRWAQVVDWVTRHFAISDPNTVRYFLTNYPHLPIASINANDAEIQVIKDEMLNDNNFIAGIRITNDDIDGVFGANGGVDRMLGEIANAINTQKREDVCANLLEDCRRRLNERLNDCLPQDHNVVMQEMRRYIQLKIDEVGMNRDNNHEEVARELKALFKVSSEWFDPIPIGFGNFNEQKRKLFYKRQLEKWADGILGEFPADKDPEERRAFNSIISAIKNVFNVNALDEAFVGRDAIFSALQNPSDGVDARLSFAFVFSNILQTGAISRPANANAPEIQDIIAGNQSASDYLIIRPLLNRLETIAQGINCGVRPPQIGDDELQQIKNELQQA